MARLHGALVVGDDDEVRHIEERRERVAEALDIRLVERGVDLVEDAEGRRLRLEDRHEERDRGHRLLAARKLADDARLLARRLRADLDARVEPVGLAVLERKQVDVGAAAAEETAEHARRTREGLAHALEGLLEARLAGVVELGDERLEACLRAVDVGELLDELLVADLELRQFVDRVEVHIAELADRLLQLVGLDLRALALDRLESIRGALGEVDLVGRAQIDLDLRERLLLEALAANLEFAAGELDRMRVALDARSIGAGAIDLARHRLDGGLRLAQTLADAGEFARQCSEAARRLGERGLALLEHRLGALDRGRATHGAFLERGFLPCDLALAGLDVTLLAPGCIERCLRLGAANARGGDGIARFGRDGLRLVEGGARCVAAGARICRFDRERVEPRLHRLRLVVACAEPLEEMLLLAGCGIALALDLAHQLLDALGLVDGVKRRTPRLGELLARVARRLLRGFRLDIELERFELERGDLAGELVGAGVEFGKLGATGKEAAARCIGAGRGVGDHAAALVDERA